MEYRELGSTGIKVSRLAFGSLTLGPLQASLSLEAGVNLLLEAVDRGINFVDTADSYCNYEYIRQVLKRKPDLIVASKSYDYTYEGMRATLEKALRQIGRDYIDIFLLHEQESKLTIEGHWPALRFLLDAKRSGKVRAVGISTHSVAAAQAAATVAEIDVIHPLVNKLGIGIIGGSLEAMKMAIDLAHQNGKGIYAMKALAGGHLLGEARDALHFVFSIPSIDSVAVGMQSTDELEFNLACVEGREVPIQIQERLNRQARRIYIEPWCTGCGACVARCHYSALQIRGGKAQVEPQRCILCSYCAGVCRDFCIKIL
ncbi:MAG: aldo/keto reductase [Clostridia bacterium]|nr:aldo/keto reductase [Clostridia bacterium]